MIELRASCKGKTDSEVKTPAFYRDSSRIVMRTEVIGGDGWLGTLNSRSRM